MEVVDDTEWQVNKDLSACNQYILEKQIDSDVEFVVGEELKLFKAHMLILTSRSPVFQKMFYGSLPEKDFPIRITDVTPAAFNTLLKYCYQECLDVPPEIALETLYAAKKYMLVLLEDACREILIKHLETETIWPVYVCSIEQDDRKLRDGCRLYFGKNFTSVAAALNCSDFLNIPHDVLLDLLQINSDNSNGENQKDVNRIMISEIELFKACNAWAEMECVREEHNPTGANRREALGACMFFIRFPTMLPSDILDVVFPTEILNMEEKYALLQYALADPSNKPKTAFLSTQHSFLISVQPLKGAIGFKGHSKFQKGEIEFSSLSVKPKEGLLLSGILYTPDLREWLRNMEKEIVVIEHWGNAVCKSVSGEVIDEKEKEERYTHLSFPEIHLKANAVYSIHVQQPEFIDFGFPRRSVSNKLQNHKLGHLNWKIKLPADVRLALTQNVYNERIVGLLARFG